MHTKKLLAISSLFLLGIMMAAFAAPVSSQGNNNPNKDLGAPTYLLNILGKKSDFNGQPDYDPMRRTMFVPENVGEWKTTSDYSNATIWVTQATEFAVTDPNMFDDGHCNLTIGSGKYQVYFVALGKPGMTAKLEGWIYNATGNEYLLKVGEVTVKHSRRPDWQSGHDMFYISAGEAATIGVTIPNEMWIFEFLTQLEMLYTNTSYLYFWNLIGGAKHIQVRFYRV